MNILIACEFSGIVREAFKAKGHNAWSCDILPTSAEGQHYQGDLFSFIDRDWDMIIAHPPCTYLTVTGNKWNKPEFKGRFPTREQDIADAKDFFMRIAMHPCPKIAIENPVGIMSTQYQKPTQIIQPYQFGHRHSKRTCLWLKGLPKLVPTDIVEPEYIIYQGKRYSAHHGATGAKNHKERMLLRSKTFQGIADAMAEQWG
jgi:hypothetical protein